MLTSTKIQTCGVNLKCVFGFFNELLFFGIQFKVIDMEFFNQVKHWTAFAAFAFFLLIFFTTLLLTIFGGFKLLL